MSEQDPKPFSEKKWWLGALGVAAVGGILPFTCKDDAPPVSTPTGYTYTNLEVGLSDTERHEFWHTSEGSDLFPVIVLQALHDVNTGKPVIESMIDYGFLPSEKSESWNRYGLPVGLSTRIPKHSPLQVPYVGLNCAACHTGEIEFDGKRLRIDGAPNMVDFEKWVLQLVASAEHTIGDKKELLGFLVRLAKLGAEDSASTLSEDALSYLEKASQDMQEGDGQPEDPVTREMLDAVQRSAEDDAEVSISGSETDAGFEHAQESARTLSPFLKELLNKLEGGLITLSELRKPPKAGPGRDDPWGIIRDTVFTTPTQLTAPTSIPHLFHTKEVDWFHADGNTTSLLARNFAQGIALGALVDPDTKASTLIAKNVERVQDLAEKLVSPAWPSEVLGEIDTERAARGKELYTTRKYDASDGKSYTCVACHASWKSQLHTLELMGTDPNRANNFLVPLDGQSLASRIKETIPPIIKATFEAQGQPLDSSRPDEWVGTGKYVARRLDGVWATAPYLHNGSVPTLYHLLLPADQRPKEFHLGHREFDPKHVGYVTNVSNPVFVFRTSSIGGSNAGHEFGKNLSEDERWDLVEYLKTL